MKNQNSKTAPETVLAFTVWVDDNFHYMDESQRYCSGKFATLDEALDKCKRIVAEYLESAYKPGMTAKELYESYLSFGEDPWIEGHSPKVFSAWTYAKAVASAIAGEAHAA